MSKRPLLQPQVRRPTHRPSEVQIAFWVDPTTDLAGFLKAGLEELLAVWDAQRLDGDGHE